MRWLRRRQPPATTRVPYQPYAYPVKCRLDLDRQYGSRIPEARRLRFGLTQSRGDIAAVDGGDARGSLERQRVVQKRLGDILGGDLAAQQVARHVLARRHPVGSRTLFDKLRRQQSAANAVGIDRVGTNAVSAVFERVLPD